MKLRKLLTLAVLAAVVLVLIEFTYRVYLFGLAGLSFAKIDSVHELGVSGLIQPASVPEAIYELKANQDAWFKLARLRTNSAGLADDEYPLVKPPNTFRIVLIGSSFSLPSGVTIEESWQNVLERMLNERTQGPRYEVINFSVGGYDLRQQAATLRQRAAAYAPDLVLVDLTLGSLTRFRVDEAYRRPFTPRAKSHPFFHSFALELFAPPVESPYPPWLPQSELPAAFERAMTDISSFAARSGLPLCFVILQHDAEARAEIAYLREQAGYFSTCVINTSPAFAGERLSDLVILSVDAHPNAKAQAIFARVVFEALAARGMVAVPR